MRIRVAVAVAALLCVAADLHAQAPRVVEDWSDAPGAGRLPAMWSFYGREPRITFPPAIVVSDGRRALWLKTEHHSVRLGGRSTSPCSTRRR